MGIGPIARRRSLHALCAASACLALLGVIAFSLGGSGDYHIVGRVGGDNAGPGIAALLHGSISGYLSHQPVMGLTSILLRLPVAGIAALAGAGQRTTYELGAFACVLPLALTAVWLARAGDLPTDRRVYGLIALLVLILSPVFRTALGAGHPEGVLAGVLATAAVVVATQGRARVAAVVLGLAIGSQDWALIAVPPVLIAVPGRRREVIMIAGAIAALLTTAVWAADPSAFAAAANNESASRFLTPLSLLWPIAVPLHLPGATVEWARAMPFGMRRPEATLVAAVLVGVPCAAWFVSGARRGARWDPLALLALLGLLRCVCDSTHEEYYAIAALIPIVAWEAINSRIAIVGALISVRAWLMYGAIGVVPAIDLYATSLLSKVVLVGFFAHRAMILPARRLEVVPSGRTAGPLTPVWIESVAGTTHGSLEPEPLAA
jgi:hypothetical protein